MIYMGKSIQLCKIFLSDWKRPISFNIKNDKKRYTITYIHRASYKETKNISMSMQQIDNQIM